jgi:UDP-3-O-[3-hydroxymyristoyl] N-acetylglucosamine deacetylase
MEFKHTIARDISLGGVGIHSGKSVEMHLRPFQGGEITFRRLDLGGLEFRLEPEKTAARNSSNLIRGEHRILTIEHLMAALAAFSIDSVLIELDGEEVPVLDGSAKDFVEALAGAGTQALPMPRNPLSIRRTFVLEDHPASIRVSPSASWMVSYRIAFDHPAIGVQQMSFTVERDSFSEQIAPARTFGFLKDVQELRARNLAMGGTMENALVLDEKKLLNGPLRYPDEFVRHKILDLIGDLYLLGRPVRGHFQVDRGGHRLHLRTVRLLLENPDLWSDSPD